MPWADVVMRPTKVALVVVVVLRAGVEGDLWKGSRWEREMGRGRCERVYWVGRSCYYTVYGERAQIGC